MDEINETQFSRFFILLILSGVAFIAGTQDNTDSVLHDTRDITITETLPATTVTSSIQGSAWPGPL